MRLPLIIASIVCWMMFSPASEASHAKRKKAGRGHRVTIHVEGRGWGNVPNAEIESVLYSVADELLSYVPADVDTPIVITHGDGGPVTLYERGPGGEFRVQLSATGRRWSQFAYQFAHELCHVVSHYDRHVGPEATRHNQWFEETLCEAASLFTLRSLAQTWASSETHGDRQSYAPKLRDYAERLIGQRHRQLPASTSLAAWLRENEEEMRSDPYLREKNEVIANLLLPLFEADPERWDTLRYLNLGPAQARARLERYLADWYASAPEDHRRFIARVLELLEVRSAAASLAREQEPAPLRETAASRAGPVGPQIENEGR